MVRIYYFFFHCFICSAVFMAGLGVSRANATSGEVLSYFYPKNGWFISQNDKKCSIQAGFNNGFIIHFHGGDKWIQSMDINFRQNVFNTGKTYDVDLNIPGIKNKTFRAKGITPDTLSVDLRRQKDFYQMLRSSAVLDLTFDVNSFRFYLTGFSKSAGEFERCMAGAVIPKEGAISTAQLSESQMEENKEENFKINESIAMEAQAKEEAQAAVREAISAGSAQAIPFKERTKLGDQIISGDAAPSGEAAGDEDEAPGTEESSFIPSKHERLLEQLVDQLDQNPFLIDEEGAPKSQVSQAIDQGQQAIDQTAQADDSTQKAFEAPPVMDKIIVVAPKKAVLPKISALDVLNSEPSTDKSAVKSMAAQEVIEPPKNDASNIVDEVLNYTGATALPINADNENEPVIALKNDDEEAGAPVIAVKSDDEEAEAPVIAVKSDDDETEAPVIALKNDDDETEAPVIVETSKITTPPIKVRKDIYKMEADFRDVTDDSHEASSLRRQIIALEKTVADLKGENIALNDELKFSLRESEQERLTIASENWNLEQATMRFNEAERQVKKLGGQLQRERAKCSAEKQDLEALLFDPQVTQAAQLARLAELESQLVRAQADLETQRAQYEERIRVLSAQSGSQ